MSWRLKIVVVSIAVIAVGAWVLIEARNTAPIREGTADGFWRHAFPDHSTDHGLWGGFICTSGGMVDLL